jgi:hypothetical protein
VRERIRSHLTYANVMATLAVFLVLGGGTALAAYVVSSNSQIGPGTISGHKPPTGKHANIIAGSINGQDIADKAVTPQKSSGLLSSSAVGRVDFAATDCHDYVDPGCQKDVVSADGFVLTAACVLGVQPSFELTTTSVPTGGETHWGFIRDGSTAENGDNTGPPNYYVVRLQHPGSATGTVILRRPGARVALEFDASVAPGGPADTASCQFHATVVKS